MKTRTDLLNHLAEKYQLKRYLEIGVQNLDQNFNKIICPDKVCVDPDSNAKATYCLTSDEFFTTLIPWKYDLIFIDGLHTADQVKRDFENALRIISYKGFIVLHDCNPLKEEHTIVPRPTERGHWNGDVYKFACELGQYYKKFNVVDIDNGCGVWNNSGYDILKDTHKEPFNWIDFDILRKEMLNLISWNEFIGISSHV